MPEEATSSGMQPRSSTYWQPGVPAQCASDMTERPPQFGRQPPAAMPHQSQPGLPRHTCWATELPPQLPEAGEGLLCGPQAPHSLGNSSATIDRASSQLSPVFSRNRRMCSPHACMPALTSQTSAQLGARGSGSGSSPQAPHSDGNFAATVFLASWSLMRWQSSPASRSRATRSPHVCSPVSSVALTSSTSEHVLATVALAPAVLEATAHSKRLCESGFKHAFPSPQNEGQRPSLKPHFA